MRIRTIKPEFFTSDVVAALPYRARLTFVGLWCYVDDEGRGRDDPRLVRAAVWPLDDDVSALDVADDLDALAAAGLVVRYVVDGRTYLAVDGFTEHQRISHPKASKLPAPADGVQQVVPWPKGHAEGLPEPSGNLPDASGKTVAGKGTGNREGEQGKGEQGTGNIPPAPSAAGPVVVRERAAVLAWSDELHPVWCDRVGAVRYSRFRKALAPIMEPPSGAPRWSVRQVAEGIKWAAVRGDRLTPETFAEGIVGYMRVLDLPPEERPMRLAAA